MHACTQTYTTMLNKLFDLSIVGNKRKKIIGVAIAEFVH